jgi:hypothetical protein
VNGFLAGLNHVFGDLVRTRITTGRTERKDLIPLRAICNGPEFAVQADVLVKSATPKPGEVRETVGDRLMTVERFVENRQDCVAVVVTYDFSAIVRNPPPTEESFVVLRPKTPGNDPLHCNPTEWAFAANGRSPTPEPCGS